MPTVGFALAMAACLMGCVTWRPTDSRLIKGGSPAELGLDSDPIVRRQQGLDQLEAHLGEPFPNLTLVDHRNNVVTLDKFRGKSTAILVATGPCPHSTDWLRTLAAAGWKPPPGYDELIVLISTGGDREFNKLIRQSPSFLVGWPLIDYLAFVRWYPIMYGVDQDGMFKEYWDTPEEIEGQKATVNAAT